MFTFFTASSFDKDFSSLPPDIQIRIRIFLRVTLEQDHMILPAKKLQGYKDIFRFRVGMYRIIFQLTKHKVILLYVKHRRDVYEAL